MLTDIQQDLLHQTGWVWPAVEQALQWAVASNILKEQITAGLSRGLYAGMAKWADAQDSGVAPSVSLFAPSLAASSSLVKAGSSCFYKRGSSNTLRLGSLAV